MDFKKIPIFIISYNRCSDLNTLINRLQKDGYSNLIVVDNASNDEELLEYLRTLDCRVEFLDKNYGHMVVWESGLFDDIIYSSYYAVTDPDVIPVEECPSNYIEIFWDILNSNPEVTKVGFSLKIDDLPICNKNRMDVIRWESFFYENVVGENPVLYKAEIDTTFALYRPGKIDNFFTAIRTGKPYEARHLPWYWNSDALGTEEKNYLKNGNMFGNTYCDREKVKKLNYQIIKKLYDDDRLELQEWKYRIYLSYVKNHKYIYIYGAGKVGVSIANNLKKYGVSIQGFIMSNRPHISKIDGIDVFEFDIIRENIKRQNAGIILATTFEYKKEILEILYSAGCTDVCSIEM